MYMKKIFMTVIATMLASTFVTNAAEREGETDVYYGGKKGDIAMSFSLNPVLDFVGNMFNGTTNQSFSGLGSVTPSVFNGTTLSGKYFLSDRMNMTLGIGFNCLSNKSYLYDENYQNKVNATTTGSNEVMFMLGANYLLRPGKRLQPVLGVNLVYARSNKNFEKVDDREDTNADTSRKTPQNTLGVIANMGVEFFFCRNVSMSALLDLGLTTASSKVKVNNWDEDYSYVTSKQTKFMTGKLGGNLAINFYF